jgi:hypothetical protein
MNPRQAVAIYWWGLALFFAVAGVGAVLEAAWTNGAAPAAVAAMLFAAAVLCAVFALHKPAPPAA